MAHFYFLNICHLHENKQTKKAGREAVVPPTHPLWHDPHVCPSTDLLTALNVHHKDWNEAEEFWCGFCSLSQMMKKLKVEGQNMSAACAANVDICQSALLPCQNDSCRLTAGHHDTTHQTRLTLHVEWMKEWLWREVLKSPWLNALP